MSTSNLAEWRQQRAGEWVTLPSGLVVFVKPVTLLDLAAQGDIPAPLLAVAQQVVAQEQVTTNTLAQLPGSTETLQLLARAMCQEPRVVDTVTDPTTEVGAAELSAYDLITLYRWASRGLAPLRPFRGEPRTTPNA